MNLFPLAVLAYYVALGLAICIITGIHKEKTPYAVGWMILLWPVVYVAALIQAYKEARGKDK